MYETGMDSLKKAALSVKVRSFLNNQGEIDPSDLDNPELSLDLQSLIDDPNFEVNEGLFPELLHDKINGSTAHTQLSLRNHLVHTQQHHNINHSHHNPQHFVGARGLNNNPLAYLPQPVHSGGFAPNSASSSPSSSPHMHHGDGGGGSGEGVKSEPMDHHRLDFNANTVSSSSDPGYSSYASNNLTSPSSSSSASSRGGGSGGGGGGSSYSPTYGGANIHQMGMHHQGVEQGLSVGKNGVLTFNPNVAQHQKMMGHPHPHSNGHHHHLSKKLKNVDKASDEYKRRRERNNVAVRKSREKAKVRSRETEERVKILCKDNERLQKKIDLLTEELTFLRSFFSNVGGLPEQIHREFNKHLETFQHHHIQNGIQFPSFASFKSMQ